MRAVYSAPMFSTVNKAVGVDDAMPIRPACVIVNMSVSVDVVNLSLSESESSTKMLKLVVLLAPVLNWIVGSYAVEVEAFVNVSVGEVVVDETSKSVAGLMVSEGF